MHRIDGQNHLNNRFQGGDPIQRVDSTVVTPEWLNAIQEEIANAIEYFGLSLDKTNNQQLRDGLNRGIVPVGSIIPFSPGYFDGNANSNFQISGPAGNTVAEINNFLPDSWRVCDGTAPNDPDSSIFNAADRFLPNLTDDIFLSGGTTSGNTGGANMRSLLIGNLPPHPHTMNHKHSSNLSVGNLANESHFFSTSRFLMFPSENLVDGFTINVREFVPSNNTRTYQTGRAYYAGALNIIDFLGNTGTGNGLNSTPFDNRPSYLSCFYIIRIK